MALENPDLKEFSINEWYEIFKHITIETTIVDIPPELLKVLQSDELCDDIKEACPEEFVKVLEESIEKYEGGAFLKNNWHAPIDAKPFTFDNTLKITEVDDIFLFLTMSETFMNDFDEDIEDAKFCLALRPYMDIHPASEFRGIVINDILQGVTSRDFLTLYPHFLKDSREILWLITDFYEHNIRGKFWAKNFTFDIVIINDDNIKVMDFGRLDSKANLYAFKWPEVRRLIAKNSSEQVCPIFRYITSDIGIMPKSVALALFHRSE